MAPVVKYTIDTSFAVKGLVPPRRKKRDEILEKQQKMQNLIRFAHNWNAGMLECWNIGLRGMKTIKKMILFGFLFPTFQHSTIPSFPFDGTEKYH